MLAELVEQNRLELLVLDPIEELVESHPVFFPAHVLDGGWC